MNLIDTHCHLTFDGLMDRVPEVVSRAHEAGVGRMITVGTSVEDSRRCAELADQTPGVYATVGVHPHDAAKVLSSWLDDLTALADSPHIVAIGETGLDYHYDFSPRDAQAAVFEAQLSLAVSKGLPLMVHCREAVEDAVAILAKHRGLSDVVFHCFTGTVAEAKVVLDHGWAVSVTGIVTFSGAGDVREVAKMIPTDRLVLETDSPYLSPEPVRKVRPNEPAHVAHIARYLASLRNEPLERVIETTTANAERLFRLGSGPDTSN